ncbi:hypothetical protein FQA39_LY11169 [Lamprigera yunnana]|nr:hypothetical protein FQA39_LY11169 [Lamprigera yunnana]
MKDVLFYALFLIFNPAVFGFNSLLLDKHENRTFQDCVSNFVLREFSENFPIFYIHDGSKSPIILHNDNNSYIIVNINQPMEGLQFCSRYYVLQVENEQTLELIINKLDFWKHRRTSSNTKFLIIAPISKVDLKRLSNLGATLIALFNYTNTIYTYDPYHKLNQCGQMCKYFVKNRCDTSKIRHETANRSFKNCSIEFIYSYLDDDVQPPNIITQFILQEFQNYLGLSINVLQKPNLQSSNASLILHVTHKNMNLPSSDTIFTENIVWVTFVSKVSPTQILQYIFERKVWILIGVTFFSISLMWCFITKLATNKWNVSTSFINVLALTLVGCTAGVSQIRALKCLTLFYLVFVIVIHATFKTNLAQLLTADQYKSGVKSLEDLVDSDLPVCATKCFLNCWFNQTIEGDTTYTKIRKKIMPMKSYKDVLAYRNCSYLLLVQHIDGLKYYGGDYKFNYFINNRLTGNVKYRFIFNSHNSFSERLNNFIQRFVENGISEHIISENNRKRYGYGKPKNEESEPQVLTMHHAYGIFVIWSVGIALSIIVFLIEIVSK